MIVIIGIFTYTIDVTFGNISAEEAANTTQQVCTNNIIYKILYLLQLDFHKRLLTIQSVNFSIKLETLVCP